MVNGTYKILYIKSGGSWYPIGCLTSNDIAETTQTLGASTRDNTNGWTSVVPTHQSIELSFSGVLTQDNRGGTVLTYGDLKTLKRARTKIEWRMAMSDGSGDTDEGYGYIVELSEAAEIDSAVTFDGAIVGTDDPSVTTWTPPTYDDIDSMIPAYDAAKT